MNSQTLKIIACATMLVDHIGFLFFPEHEIFRFIGRISFPLFAFLIAEGFQKTRNLNQYIKRLSLFAIISQIPFFFFEKLGGTAEPTLNILFTLILGILALILITKQKNITIKVVGVVGIVILASLADFSYGGYGILTIIGSYLFLKHRKTGFVALSLLPFIETVRLFLFHIFFFQFFAIFSLIPLYFYNGIPGKQISRWWFYWFYPVHLAILSALFILLK